LPSIAATTDKGKFAIAFDIIYNTQKKSHNSVTTSSATPKRKLTIAFDVIHKSPKKVHKYCLQCHPQLTKESFLHNIKDLFTSSHTVIAHTTG